MKSMHIKELARAVRNYNFERMEDGRLLFPEQKLFVGGIFEMARNDGPFEVCDNVVTFEGMDYLFNTGGLASGGFIVPFATNTAPTTALTAANFGGTLTEFTNYVETTRQAWTNEGSDDGVITNAAAPAIITIGALTGSVNTSCYGAGINLTVGTKGGGTGVCFCAMLAPKAKTGLDEGETLSFKYGIAGTSS